MKRKTLEQLKAERDKLNGQIARKQSEVRKRERKDDANRKIIVGAIVMAHMERDEAFRRQVEDLLDRHVTRERDRKRLGLSEAVPATTSDDQRP